MPSLLTRCLLGAAMLASALVEVDSACPTVNVKTRGPDKVKAGKSFTYNIRVTLPEAGRKGITKVDATTLQLTLPEAVELKNHTKAIRVSPRKDDVGVDLDGSTISFTGLQDAKKYRFKIKVRHEETCFSECRI